MTDRDIVTCEGCGVKYDADVAGNECPVCGHRRRPKFGFSAMTTATKKSELELMNAGLDNVQLEYDEELDTIRVKNKTPE